MYQWICYNQRYHFLILTQVAVMCLLVPVDARRRTAKPINLGSLFRQESCLNQAGNLLQIHFDGGSTQAKCDGTSTKSLTTSKSHQRLHHLQCIQQCYCLTWFLNIALRFPSAHDFRVIIARNWAQALTKVSVRTSLTLSIYCSVNVIA